MLAGYPFTKGISQEQELENFESVFRQYQEKSHVDSLGALTAREQRFVPEMLTEAVNYSRVNGDSLAYVRHYYELLKWQLNSISLVERVTEFAITNRKYDEYLLNMLLQVVNDGNTDPRIWMLFPHFI